MTINKVFLTGNITRDPELRTTANGFNVLNAGIAVNERYETSIPHIYAIGDVSSKIQLAHVATAQGIACVELLCGKENHTSMSVVPSCIYCRPEIAVVGMTEAEAKEAGIPVKVGKHVMFDNAKTLISPCARTPRLKRR